MEWSALCKLLFAEYQLHVFTVMTVCMILWFRMDKRHSNESIKNNIKFQNVDEDIKEIKTDVKEIRKEVRDGKKDTDDKIIELARETEIKIEDKWKRYHGEKEVRIEEEVVQ